jgi:hypothetical protein
MSASIRKFKKKTPFPRQKTPSPEYTRIQREMPLEQRLTDPTWRPYFLDPLEKKIYDQSLKRAIRFFIDKYKNHREICKSHTLIYKIFYKPGATRHTFQFFNRIEPDGFSVHRAEYKIKECFHNPRLELIFVPVIISHEGFNSSHQCLVIINRVLQTIEFYDPMGVNAHDGNYERTVLNALYHFFKSIPETSGYMFINPYDIMLKIGLQGFESKSTAHDDIGLRGYCVAWSIFMTELRIQHPNLPAKELYKQYTPIFKNQQHGVELMDIIVQKKERTAASKELVDALRKFIIEYTIYLGPYLKRH